MPNSCAVRNNSVGGGGNSSKFSCPENRVGWKIQEIPQNITERNEAYYIEHVGLHVTQLIITAGN